MPIYEYRCPVCGRKFEKLRSLRDNDNDVRCPHCESEKVERVLSGFALSGCSSKPGSRFR
ncbi:MAG: zinc ribbon domain-containing protein [Acidobacteriia bacterium]|nr:zinc ribbon domain-containing protein [Terriglobia bacterium]